MESSVNRHEAAKILLWAGLSLILVFVVSVLAAAYPLALASAQWRQELCGQLRGAASFPLVGALMMLIALQLDSELPPLAQWLRLFRRLCLLASLGYLWLIPLQTQAALGVARSATSQERLALQSLSRNIQAVRNADTEATLRQAISTLPGAPPMGDRSFGDRFPAVRRRLLEQLEPQLKGIEAGIAERNRARIMEGLQSWIRDGLISACYAFGFAGLGKAGDKDPSLLDFLVRY
jgi:hypothetical protein